MKYRKKLKSIITVIVVLITIMISIFYLSQISFDKDTNAAKSTVQEYFKYQNKHDKSRYLSTLPIRNRIWAADLSKFNYVKLYWIKQGSYKLVKSYMKDGIGKVEHPYNVKVFHIISSFADLFS